MTHKGSFALMRTVPKSPRYLSLRSLETRHDFCCGHHCPELSVVRASETRDRVRRKMAKLPPTKRKRDKAAASSSHPKQSTPEIVPQARARVAGAPLRCWAHSRTGKRCVRSVHSREGEPIPGRRGCGLRTATQFTNFRIRNPRLPQCPTATGACTALATEH